MKLRCTLLFFLAQAIVVPVAPAQNRGQDHWVATWTTAQLLYRAPVAPPANPPANPVPANTPQAIARGFNHQTVRMVVHTSIRGNKVRVKLANAFGSGTVAVGAAHVALRSKDSQVLDGSDRVLTFGGKPNCSIGPGMVLLSDPMDLTVAPLSDLAVSLFFPGETGPPTSHNTGLHTTYISKEGDFTGQAAITDTFVTTASYYFLAGVDVIAPAKAGLIVAFGDSITDGTAPTVNTDHSW